MEADPGRVETGTDLGQTPGSNRVILILVDYGRPPFTGAGGFCVGHTDFDGSVTTMNPLRAWRESRGLTRVQLSVIAAVSYSQIAAAESGHAAQLPRRIARAVARLDGEPAARELVTAFAQWRDEQASRIAAALGSN